MNRRRGPLPLPAGLTRVRLFTPTAGRRRTRRASDVILAVVSGALLTVTSLAAQPPSGFERALIDLVDAVPDFLDVLWELAIALLALIAVLPEYAVDLYYAYRSGTDPSYLHYAAANMTGSNRLLLGFGWPLVVILVLFTSGHWAGDIVSTYVGALAEPVLTLLIMVGGLLIILRGFGFRRRRTYRPDYREGWWRNDRW